MFWEGCTLILGSEAFSIWAYLTFNHLVKWLERVLIAPYILEKIRNPSWFLVGISLRIVFYSAFSMFLLFAILFLILKVESFATYIVLE